MVTKQIRKYSVYMFAKVAKQKEVNARITCNCDDNYRLHIYFVKPGVTVKPSETTSTGKVGYLFMPFSSFLYYTDILRNEKPLYASISTSNPAQNQLRTGAEDVGEEES